MARQAFIQSEVSETLKAFYCAVCEKQFTKVAQYDEHCNSYSVSSCNCYAVYLAHSNVTSIIIKFVSAISRLRRGLKQTLEKFWTNDEKKRGSEKRRS